MTAPGVYDMPSEEYHACDALSSSGARKLLSPSCPALFRWHRDNPQPPNRVFDFGHAAHKMVLGEGAELVVINHADYRTNAAKESRDEAYADGRTPLLAHEAVIVRRMAVALEAHPAADLMMRPGKPEQSLFAKDVETGVMLRARLDWLPEAVDGKLTVVDYKTAASVEPAAFARSVARYGYFQQDPWYRDIVLALELADEVEFIFIAQAKEPPYLVTMFKLDDYSLEVGRKRNRKAIDLFAECTERDDWPTYAQGVETLTVPVWADDDDEIVIS